MLVKDQEYLDFSKVPESTGAPRFLIVIAAIGLVSVFIIGGFVVAWSGYGHHWPATKTMRIDLGKK